MVHSWCLQDACWFELNLERKQEENAQLLELSSWLLELGQRKEDRTKARMCRVWICWSLPVSKVRLPTEQSDERKHVCPLPWKRLKKGISPGPESADTAVGRTSCPLQRAALQSTILSDKQPGLTTRGRNHERCAEAKPPLDVPAPWHPRV